MRIIVDYLINNNQKDSELCNILKENIPQFQHNTRTTIHELRKGNVIEMAKFLLEEENFSKIIEYNYHNSTFWQILPLLISKTFGLNITIVKVQNATCKEETIKFSKSKRSLSQYEEFEYINTEFSLVEWNCLTKSYMLLNEVK